MVRENIEVFVRKYLNKQTWMRIWENRKIDKNHRTKWGTFKISPREKWKLLKITLFDENYLVTLVLYEFWYGKWEESKSMKHLFQIPPPITHHPPHSLIYNIKETCKTLFWQEENVKERWVGGWQRTNGSRI